MKTYKRNGMLYVAYEDWEGNKKRRSTGLKYNAFNVKYFKKYYDVFFTNKKAFVKKALLAYDNDWIEKEEAKQNKTETAGDRDFLVIQNRLIDSLLPDASLNTLKMLNSNFNITQQFFLMKNYKLKDFIEPQKSTEILNNFYYHLKQTRSTVSIKALFKYLKRILTFAKQQGLFYDFHFTMPKFTPTPEELEKTFEEPFDYTDAVRIIKAAEDKKFKLFLSIAFFTGMRTGEILALTPADFDFNKKEIRITKTLIKHNLITAPKTPASVGSVTMLKIIEDYFLNLANSGQLNTQTKDRIFNFSMQTARRFWKKILTQLNLPFKTLYTTRHSFASMMLKRGEDIGWISAKMLRHSNLNQTLKTYAKYIKSDGQAYATFIKESDFIETEQKKNESTPKEEDVKYG